MILRSASSLDLNLRAAAPRCPNGARLKTTTHFLSASSRPCKSIPRASSEGNLYEMRPVETKTDSSKVLDRSGGSNGGFGGEGGGVDGYYEEMIQRYPGDALLLANYARFLKEVKGDGRKAEEYCERAMLTENGRDGELLSMYGDLIWQNHGDGHRAHSYFDQAVQSSPDDCHVLASYARFLWDTEEEEEEEIKYENGFSPYSNQSVTVVS